MSMGPSRTCLFETVLYPKWPTAPACTQYFSFSSSAVSSIHALLPGSTGKIDLPKVSNSLPNNFIGCRPDTCLKASNDARNFRGQMPSVTEILELPSSGIFSSTNDRNPQSKCVQPHVPSHKCSSGRPTGPSLSESYSSSASLSSSSVLSTLDCAGYWVWYVMMGPCSDLIRKKLRAGINDLENLHTQQRGNPS